MPHMKLKPALRQLPVPLLDVDEPEIMLGMVDGVDLTLVWDFCQEWCSTEHAIGLLREEQAARADAMRKRGVPVGTVKLAMAIWKKSQKLDASHVVLEACVRLLAQQTTLEP